MNIVRCLLRMHTFNYANNQISREFPRAISDNYIALHLV